MRNFINSLRDGIGRSPKRPAEPVEVVASRSTFYPQVDSCQIPNLGVIFERFIGRRTDGLFVEVGANDGVYVSNSWGLAERHWHGILIEPVPEFAHAATVNHAGHPKVKVIQEAVTAPGIDEIELRLAGALTTGSSDLYEQYVGIDWAQSSMDGRLIVVPATSLDKLLTREEVQEGFEVLVVDVEGLEFSVLKGFTVSRWRPQLMIWELADLHPDVTSSAADDESVLSSIVNQGYRIAYKDHINTVFIRDDVWIKAWNRSD